MPQPVLVPRLGSTDEEGCVLSTQGLACWITSAVCIAKRQ